MKICLVATFPPSGRQLNEYAFHVARQLARNPGVELTILADELTDCEFATDEHGHPLKISGQSELPDFNVIRCWKFGSLATPTRLLKTIRKLNPDVVWFNLVFSSFATPDKPAAAFAGLSTPALVRAAGYYTHVTLHHIIEHVDFAAAGLKRGKLFDLGSDLATRALLKANSISVLLPTYRQTLSRKYKARNVLLSTHGIFAPTPTPPDFTKRGNPHKRILAIGHWGTYKRLETLMEAFPLVLKAIPEARLVIGGANHHTRAGYWESIRDAQPPGLPIDFRGYIQENEIPELFQSASVLVLPYDSTTGSSGPAHQACEYGIPIVCADIPDLRGMVTDEDMAVRFYKVGNAADLARQMIEILQSPSTEHAMAQQNYAAGVEMSMTTIINNYLRWFRLNKAKLELSREADRVKERAALCQKNSAAWTLRVETANQQLDLLDVEIATATPAQTFAEIDESLYRKWHPRSDVISRNG
jgi:glycosyltransferase involved in cell wall biosynthesis